MNLSTYCLSGPVPHRSLMCSLASTLALSTGIRSLGNFFLGRHSRTDSCPLAPHVGNVSKTCFLRPWAAPLLPFLCSLGEFVNDSQVRPN